METKKLNKKCPNCNRGVLKNRAKRPAFIKATLFWLPIRRYECNYCYKKSYVFGSVFENESSENKGDDSQLLMTGSDILNQVKSKLQGSRG